MRILMVVAYFVPEVASASHVYFDLAKSFVKNGHEVDVITSYPRNVYLTEEGKDYSLDEVIDGINVHRCDDRYLRRIPLIRGISQFIIPRIYASRYRKLGKSFDACLIYIPPLPLYRFAKKVKRMSGLRSVLNFQDFHPQELTDVGAERNRFIIGNLKKLEREAYGHSDHITVLSEGGVDYILNRGGDCSNISHIYNGTRMELLETNKFKSNFKKREGIENKLLISYAGVLAPYQCVDTILDAANELSEDGEIIFYVIGDGNSREGLQRRIHDEDIANLKLMPYQPREEYMNIINSSDITLVSLDIRMKAPCLPGKLTNLMGLEKPVIATVPFDSETAKVIQMAGSGIVVNPGDQVGLKEAILKLRSDEDLRRKMGENGRKFVENNMNLDLIVGKYEKIFSDLMDNGKG